ncbi:ATP-dependent metallopeptidase FtsH/Yme1/Tma family protein [Candidatus Daviesbacteria bacterium]|nr:ATP-dependent metallopeptidase FtsH/Yme1/Tma family protein [Candidatus Daviesbacteria bacterium]
MANNHKGSKLLPKLPKKTPNDLSSIAKNAILYGFLMLLIFGFFYSLSQPLKEVKEIPLSQVLNDVKEGKVDSIQVNGDQLEIFYKNKDQAQSRKEPDEGLVKTFEAAGIDPKTISIQIKDQANAQLWLNIIGTIAPIAVMILIFFFIFRQAREAGNSVFSFGQSRAKLFSKDLPKITFADVAGVDEAKQELQEVVDFLKHPEKYQALGARTPKGVLLIGPAGTGKTLMARAVAGEAGVPFFSVAGSEFMEMLVGVGASRVRDLFANAKKSAPSIIFIDEVESIGRMRGFGFAGGHDEREQTLNQILVEMDGFTPNEAVIVLAATNRPDLLDPALTRPGRFDRQVALDLPDIEGRKAILKIHMKGKPFDSEVDLERTAKRTVGFSGADLANMLNEAAILAARNGKKAIDAVDLEEAATKVKLGPQRKRMQSEEERKMTAYHEAGHAIVAHFSPKIDPVHRISIVARGRTGGHTFTPPEIDRYTETQSRLLQQIATLLGGRAGEEFEFNELTTGAANDLEIANAVAREMVTEFGMSELGPIVTRLRPSFGFWPREGGGEVSEELSARIDNEINRIITTGYNQATALLKEHKKELDAVAKELLEKETLDADEFVKIVGMRPAA